MQALSTLYQSLELFVNPWLTSLPDRPDPTKPVTRNSNIMDISQIGVKQLWELKNHLQECSDMATKNHPDTVGEIFVSGGLSRRGWD
jgi:hypothetical protein